MPAAPFATDAPDRLFSATGGEVVTPNDDADLGIGFSRLVRVGTEGDLAVKLIDGTTLTIPSVQSGESLPISVTRILSTGTTATDIVAFK